MPIVRRKHAPKEKIEPTLPGEVRAAAERGWKMFPVEPRGKRPCIRNWPELATSDIAQLEKWADQFPGCNWGCATGTASGFFAVDFDGEKGRASMAALAAQGFKFSETRAHETGNGLHLLYTMPGHDIRNSASKVSDGIDIRANGGFIVIPPSVHPSGRPYRVIFDAPVAPAPQWLLDRLQAKAMPSQVQTAAPCQTFGQGERTKRMVSLAGSLTRAGASVDAIAAALLAENSARCVPPLDEGKTRAIACDISRRYAKGEPLQAQGPRMGLALVRGTEIADVPQAYLIQDFIPIGAGTLLVGKQGDGKTTAYLKMCAELSRGIVPIIGGAREPGAAIIVSNEDAPAHIRRQFVSNGGDLTKLFVSDVAKAAWSLDNVAALKSSVEEIHPTMVVVDSLFSHSPSAIDMHKHSEVAPVLAGLCALAAEYNFALLLVHHYSKAITADALQKVGGSTGISSTVRQMLCLGIHPQDAALRVISVEKTNLDRDADVCPGYTFSVSRPAPRTAVVEWRGATSLRAADYLGAKPHSDTPAEAFLKYELGKGPRAVKELIREAEARGIARRTLYNACASLGIESSGTGKGAAKLWELPARARAGMEMHNCTINQSSMNTTTSATFNCATGVNCANGELHNRQPPKPIKSRAKGNCAIVQRVPHARGAAKFTKAGRKLRTA